MLVHTLPFFFLHLQDAFGEKRKRKETARRGDLFQLSRHFHFSSELLKKTRRRENREHVEKKRVRNAASITAVDSLYTCKKKREIERETCFSWSQLHSIDSCCFEVGLGRFHNVHFTFHYPPILLPFFSILLLLFLSRRLLLLLLFRPTTSNVTSGDDQLWFIDPSDLAGCEADKVEEK